MGKNKTSPHILSTASNLLGLCFIVLTALKVQDLREATLIDEFTIVDIVFFMTSSILSFISMKTEKDTLSDKFESIADSFFFIGLIVMFITTILAAMNYIQ